MLVATFETHPVILSNQRSKMKKRTWLSSLKNFVNGTGSRKVRRRYHKSNNLQFDSLEARNLLATVSFDAGTEALTFQSDVGVADIVTVSAPDVDTLQIQVGGGEAISLSGDAVGNSDFVLSQSVNVDDTLQINVGSSIVSDCLLYTSPSPRDS